MARPGRWLRLRRRARSGRETGLSLIEMVVAVSLVGGVFVAAANVLTQMMMAGLYSRQNQQAIDVVSETIEAIRGYGYAATSISSADPTLNTAADPALVAGASAFTFTPFAGGPAEPVAAEAGGSINPHLETKTRNATAYRVGTYVTYPADSIGQGGQYGYKRVTVRATWSRQGATHTRQATTFVTLTRRGLPLPQFIFGDAKAQTLNQGTLRLQMGAHLTNRGARDTWNLSVSTSPTRSTWNSATWYLAPSGASTVDFSDPANPPTPLPSVAGQYNTGPIEPDKEIWMVAVVDLAPAEATGVVDATLKAVSMSQPAADTGTASFTNRITIQSGAPCPGCTATNYYLRNGPGAPSGATAAGSDMPMTQDSAPTVTASPPYDFDNDGNPGRTVAAGGAADGTETALTRMANWRYESPTTTLTFAGPATVYVYAATAGFVPGSAQLSVHVWCQSGSSYTSVGSGTASFTQSDSLFHAVAVPVPSVATCKPGKNKKIEVKVQVPAGQPAMWIAYDLTGFASFAQLPMVTP